MADVSTRSILCASVAAVAIGGPLLAMMAFSFMATATLVLITSPLLFIFSPLLLCAGFLIVGALTGFAVATAAAVGGMSMIGWIYREVKLGLGLISGGGGGGEVERWDRAAEQRKMLGDDVREKGDKYSPHHETTRTIRVE